ncbi:MAG: SIR2 family protein [Saprospiraceae bacterium]|nr:SIR2 family protein [Saprospiraceae bacterium]
MADDKSHPVTAELYQSIARKVKDGACVLFLGAGAVMAKGEDNQFAPLTTLCAKHLAKKYQLALSEEEARSLSYVCSLLRVRNLSTDNVLQEDVAAFYAEMADKCELHPILEQLCDLRFRIIINAAPDNFVAQLYDQVAQPYFSDFYNFYKPASGFNFEFEKDHRLVVYNLLGFYKKPESLVLTYKQQLNYIKKIVGEQQNERLPDGLTNAFKDFRHHLFLGFDFDEWALRLLLDTLYKNVRDNIQPYAYPTKTEEPTESDTKVFFQGEFGMQFPGVDMETFVQNLIQHYQSLDGAAAGVSTEAPKAKILVLYNETADKDGFDQLHKHLRALPAQIVTLAEGIGQGDMQTWLRQMLQECQVVLPLLSADFYDPASNPAVSLLAEIAQRNNPRKGCLVMPILIKNVALDGPLASLATLRPPNRLPLFGQESEAQFISDTVDSLKKYIDNLSRS